MKAIPYYNDSENAVWIGGQMIPPGCCRMVDASLLPSDPVPAELEQENDPLAELLIGTVDAVLAKLPELSTEEVERLGELEQVGQQRKGILGPIAER